MKRILSIFICLIFVFSIISCEKKDAETEKSTDATQESNTEKSSNIFISTQERLTWKDKIINTLSNNNSYEEIEYGCLGTALMDLNFDNTPELIVAGSGGSMGNVCIVAYDLESGEQLCVLYDTPHYQDWNNVYFCVHKSNGGNYILVNEGALRVENEFYLITSKLTDNFKFNSIFEEAKITDDDIRYYYDDTEVSKADFEKQKAQFKNDYKAITETQLKIIYWDSIEAKTKNEAIFEMANKLVNSEQQFIRFDAITPADNVITQASLANYKQAYLNFLKDKKDSHRLFSLVFIDNDDIPELYLKGVSEAEGDMICSFKNDTVIQQLLNRTGGGKYIERSGNIINQNGNMGRCYTNVYKLNESGFAQTFNALSIETVENDGENYNLIYEYFIDDTSVSEAQYSNALNSAFDFSQSVRLDKNAVSYDEIIQQLQNGNSEGK